MALKWFGKKKKEDEQAATPEAATPEAETSEAANADSTSADAAASPSTTEAQPEKKEGRFARLFKGLAKTRDNLVSMLPFGRKLDEEALEQIESTLIAADFGPVTAMDLVDELRDSFKDKEFDEQEILPFLKERLVARLGANDGIRWAEDGPTVIVVAGVNGTGKTTSIAKISRQLREEGKTVILAAADTFRAAAMDQLGIWSERLGVEMVRGKEGGDPSAVVFDAIDRGIEANVDVIIVDTAGRLHTEKNLMQQLSKMARVIQKRIPEGPHEVLQVLDATTGQNAIQQATEFNKAMPVTGLVLTKLDGTARGGVIFPILHAVGLPVKFIGVGEGVEDLQVFEPARFVDALFE